MNKTDKKAIEEMARQNCHIEYHMKNYKTCKECYETNYCACRVYEVCRNLYNAGFRKQSGWISVEERLPDIDPFGKGRYGGARSVRVLCACEQKDGRTFVKEGYYEPCGNGNIVWRIPGSIDSVTHWMPLPEPPKMKGVSHD